MTSHYVQEEMNIAVFISWYNIFQIFFFYWNSGPCEFSFLGKQIRITNNNSVVIWFKDLSALSVITFTNSNYNHQRDWTHKYPMLLSLSCVIIPTQQTQEKHTKATHVSPFFQFGSIQSVLRICVVFVLFSHAFVCSPPGLLDQPFDFHPNWFNLLYVTLYSLCCHRFHQTRRNYIESTRVGHFGHVRKMCPPNCFHTMATLLADTVCLISR